MQNADSKNSKWKSGNTLEVIYEVITEGPTDHRGDSHRGADRARAGTCARCRHQHSERRCFLRVDRAALLCESHREERHTSSLQAAFQDGSFIHGISACDGDSDLLAGLHVSMAGAPI